MCCSTDFVPGETLDLIATTRSRLARVGSLESHNCSRNASPFRTPPISICVSLGEPTQKDFMRDTPLKAYDGRPVPDPKSSPKKPARKPSGGNISAPGHKKTIKGGVSQDDVLTGK